MISISRYHDISCGHRVVGHEGKCALLHGHNYRIYFTVAPKLNVGLDHVGRVFDFGAVKGTLCDWLENNWDHRFLVWDDDQFLQAIFKRELRASPEERAAAWGVNLLRDSIVWVPFNPTAENMAGYLRTVIGPLTLPSQLFLTSVVVEETRKCSAESKA